MNLQEHPEPAVVAVDFRFPVVIATCFFGVVAATLSAIAVAVGAGA